MCTPSISGLRGTTLGTRYSGATMRINAQLASGGGGFSSSESQLPCWPAKLRPSSIADEHGHKLLNGGNKHTIDIH